MSVVDALTHMTGLAGSLVPGHPTDDAFARAVHDARHGMTLEGVCTLLAGFPLKFQPGTRWNYGLSTDICARLPCASRWLMPTAICDWAIGRTTTPRRVGRWR